MEVLFELLFELVGEVLLQVLFQAVASLGVHGFEAIRQSVRQERGPWLSGAGYALMGTAAGALSLWLLPALVVHGLVPRLVNLLLAPIAAGASMAAIGAWRQRRDLTLLRLDRFAYGYAFALAMALVRFTFGH